MGKYREKSPKYKRGGGVLPLTSGTENLLREAVSRPMLDDSVPISERQRVYQNAIRCNTLTFGIGPAGVGKTWIATAEAARAVIERKRLIITRPAVEAGEELGFLPGELEEKFGPWFRPVRMILEKMLGRGHVEAMIKAGRIEGLPLAHMRGHTFDDAFVILDEAQNTTRSQMKMFLTRIGQDCTVVVDGDLSQNDLPPGTPSGLHDALDRLEGMPDCAVVRFGEEDIVRSGIVQDIVQRYRNPVSD